MSCKHRLLGSVICCIVLHAQALPAVQASDPGIVLNPELRSEDDASGSIRAWRVDGKGAVVVLDTEVRRGECATARIEFQSGNPYAGLAQRLSNPDAFRGRTLVVTGWIMRETDEPEAGVWIRAFSADGKSLAYANTYALPKGPPMQWRQHEIELTVPVEAAGVMLGAALYGQSGRMWVSELNARIR
jgi:hypothetical protein